jgi:phospholipase/carboxylesterase
MRAPGRRRHGIIAPEAAVTNLYFSHIYQPPPGADRRTLLLLHGPAGDEHELLPVAQALQPTAAILSPRGQINEEGSSRFFRRVTEDVFDLGDLQRRAEQLAAFVAGASIRYRFDPREVVAVGLSDGATLASTLMLAWPATLAGAVLFRSAAPAMPPRMPKLPGTPVLLANGRYDPVVQPEDTEDLAALLRVAGADVSVALQTAAQQIVQADIEEARSWLTSCGRMRSPMRMS